MGRQVLAYTRAEGFKWVFNAPATEHNVAVSEYLKWREFKRRIHEVEDYEIPPFPDMHSKHAASWGWLELTALKAQNKARHTLLEYMTSLLRRHFDSCDDLGCLESLPGVIADEVLLAEVS